ncbi:MAG: hypothetical protein ABL876_17425 [Chitinophagaceae bacterium]
MIYLGLDLSTVSTGWAIFEDGRLAIHGKIAPPKDLDTIQRCIYIGVKIKEIVAKFDPNVVMIEDTHYSGNYATTRILNRLGGMAIFVIETTPSGRGLTATDRIRFIQPTSARAHIGLLPKSGKRGIINAVNGKFGTQLGKSDDDEADAITTAYAGYAEDNKIGAAFKQIDKKFYKSKVLGLKTPKLKKQKSRKGKK